jgi:hypothetical protein
MQDHKCTIGWKTRLSSISRIFQQYGGRGTAFQKTGRQVECTLLALWEDGYKDPWLILTDLPPEASDAAWYGLRAWIEQGLNKAPYGRTLRTSALSSGTGSLRA